jgi:hypothetical protein
VGQVAGTDATLKSLETTFQQDLNGDGSIGAASSMTARNPTLEGFAKLTGNEYFSFRNDPASGAHAVVPAGLFELPPSDKAGDQSARTLSSVDGAWRDVLHLADQSGPAVTTEAAHLDTLHGGYILIH